MPRLEPLQDIKNETVLAALRLAKERLGFIPNSLRIMARRPEIVAAFSNLSHQILFSQRISAELTALISHISSRAAGCQYCSAHTAGLSLDRNVPDDKIEHIWEYASNPIFSAAERAALNVALLASQLPNGVSDEHFDELRQHFDDEQITEIIAVIALFGFLNRWNDTLATPLESGPRDVGEQHLKGWGWTAGKHAV